MQYEPTTIRELGIMVKDFENSHLAVHEDLVERLERIEAQTIKTNGRVSKLEQWQTGIIAIGSLVAFAISTLVLWFSGK